MAPATGRDGSRASILRGAKERSPRSVVVRGVCHRRSVHPRRTGQWADGLGQASRVRDRRRRRDSRRVAAAASAIDARESPRGPPLSRQRIGRGGERRRWRAGRKGIGRRVRGGGGGGGGRGDEGGGRVSPGRDDGMGGSGSPFRRGRLPCRRRASPDHRSQRRRRPIVALTNKAKQKTCRTEKSLLALFLLFLPTFFQVLVFARPLSLPLVFPHPPLDVVPVGEDLSGIVRVLRPDPGDVVVVEHGRVFLGQSGVAPLAAPVVESEGVLVGQLVRAFESSSESPGGGAKRANGHFLPGQRVVQSEVSPVRSVACRDLDQPLRRKSRHHRVLVRTCDIGPHGLLDVKQEHAFVVTQDGHKYPESAIRLGVEHAALRIQHDVIRSVEGHFLDVTLAGRVY